MHKKFLASDGIEPRSPLETIYKANALPLSWPAPATVSGYDDPKYLNVSFIHSTNEETIKKFKLNLNASFRIVYQSSNFIFQTRWSDVYF